MSNINNRLMVICSLVLIIGLAILESEASQSSPNYQLESGGITAAGGWSSGNSRDLFSSFGPSQPIGRSESANYKLDVGPLLPPTEEVIWGDVSQDGSVTAFDASMILQHLVGITTLPEASLKVADVSHNGTVTAFDAAMILQFVVGLIDSLDESTNAPSFSPLTRRMLSIPTVRARSKEKVEVPLLIDNLSGILSGELTVMFNPDILRFVTMSTCNAMDGFEAVSKMEKGTLKLAFAPSAETKQPFASLKGRLEHERTREILLLEFEVIHDKTDYTEVTLEQGKLNEGVKVELKSGRVELIPKETVLLQNFPNPFNPDTWIPFKLAEDERVEIEIYEISGRLVRKLLLGHLKAGSYTDRSRAAYWDGRDSLRQKVASGVYFYTLQAGEFRATRKMVVVK